MSVTFPVHALFSLRDKMSSKIKGIKGNVDKFSVGAKAAFRSIIPHVKELDDQIKKITVGNLLAKGITMAAGAVKDAALSIPEFANRADEIGKTAGKLGLTTDALQRYRYAAGLANVENDTLGMAFQKMTTQMGNGSLYTSLDKLDSGLSAQVKTAKNVDGAFRMIAEAANNYADIGQRNAVLTAAFGKAGTQLVPMLGDLAEQMEAAGKYGNIISPTAIETAQAFNDTMSRVQSMLQFFGDIIRGAVIENMLPLIEKFQEWAASNREVIKTNIAEWVTRIIGWIQFLAGIVGGAITIIDRFKDAIILVAIAMKAWEIGKSITLALEAHKVVTAATTVATGALGATTVTTNASIAAGTGILGAAKAAMLGFNAAIAANPIGFIVTAVVVGITAIVIGMSKLSEKVGGLGNAFKVVFQTIMKYLLTPLNLVIDYFGTVLKLIANVTGAKWAENAAGGLQSFQDKMNTMLTGSTSTLTNSGPGFLADPYRNARAKELSRREAEAEQKRKEEDERKAAEEEAFRKMMEGYMGEIAINTGDTASALKPSSSKKLNYSQMGIDDIWAVVRAGI